jgi:hypothetical protein
MDRNLFSQLDYLAWDANAVASAARELERQQPLMYELPPVAQRVAQEQVTMYKLADVCRLVTDFQPATHSLDERGVSPR